MHRRLKVCMNTLWHLVVIIARSSSNFSENNCGCPSVYMHFLSITKAKFLVICTNYSSLQLWDIPAAEKHGAWTRIVLCRAVHAWLSVYDLYRGDRCSRCAVCVCAAVGRYLFAALGCVSEHVYLRSVADNSFTSCKVVVGGHVGYSFTCAVIAVCLWCLIWTFKSLHWNSAVHKWVCMLPFFCSYSYCISFFIDFRAKIEIQVRD